MAERADITVNPDDPFNEAVATTGLFLLITAIIAVAFALARRRGENGPAAALLYGGPLLLTGILWRVYNAITDRIGLDKVANLAVNLVLFVGIGAACGFGWRALAGRR